LDTGKTKPYVLSVQQIAVTVRIQISVIHAATDLFYLTECVSRKISALVIQAFTYRMANASYASHRVKIAITTAHANNVPNNFIF